jgi:hypothetical protein
MNFTTQTGRDDYALRSFSQHKQDQSTKSGQYKIRVILEAYDAFMSLRTTATELASFFSGFGVDYRGSSKKSIAHYYVANDNNMQNRYPFERLVELYGCRNF